MKSIIIREPQFTDESAFLEGMQRSENLHYPWAKAPITSSEFHEYIQGYQQTNQKSYLVCEKNNQIVGIFNISEIVRGLFQNAYLEFYGVAGYTAKGYMSAGLKLVLNKVIDKIKELLSYELSARKIAKVLGYSSHIALNTYINKRKLLIAQVDNFLAKLDDFDRCFVNGDMVNTHVFIENGHLTGIIDWGDATVTDRHYELGKLLDTFDWDKRLLKTVLETSNWPVKKNFCKQSLGLALYRQAVGLTQHNSFDVFYQLPNLLPLEDTATLDDLADILFGV
jgi:hypothetical protein